MATREEKYKTFRALHERAGAFVIPNPWDAGSAKILAALGFEALATTSAGCAFSLGYLDSAPEMTRELILANAKSIVDATTIPVSADLQNGFGNAPEMCAETIRLAASAGLAGGSIEDYSGDDNKPYLRISACGRARFRRGQSGARGKFLSDRARRKLSARPARSWTTPFAGCGHLPMLAPTLFMLPD